MCSTDNAVTNSVTATDSSMLKQTPRVISSEPLENTKARWVNLHMLKYIDQTGKQRPWECAGRLTRGESGIDGVSILAIIHSKTNAFLPSVVIIEQYRPCVDKVVIELPAGLIDRGETLEEAAIRELREETGYRADSVQYCSPIVVADPGMTNANMKLAMLNITLEDKLEHPEHYPDAGEHIVQRVVAVKDVYDVLQEYAKQDNYLIDARLFHWAFGLNMARSFF